MRSEYVRQEWEHAVTLARPNFIRPTYWEQPMPRSDNPLLPPSSLSKLHFHSLASPQAAEQRAEEQARRQAAEPAQKEAQEQAFRQAEQRTAREAEEQARRRLDAQNSAGRPPSDSYLLRDRQRSDARYSDAQYAAPKRRRAAVVRRAAVFVGVLVLFSILILLLWSK
jgi:hypothetical protein